jgi:hypothetical protein
MVEQVKLRTSLSGVAQVKSGFASIGGSVKGLQGSVLNLKTAVAGLGAAFVIKGIVTTNRDLQVLKARLKTITGSTEAANQEWDRLLQFTKDTPFSIEQVVTSFTRLKAIGLDPTAERMTAFGDIAAGMGKDIGQFAEAVADAVTGETERLKEFGIKASQEGDKISFTFAGITTTVNKNADEITAALTKLGQENFAGAMTEQMDTLQGVFSNLGVAATEFSAKVGEAGLNESVKATTLSLTKMLDESGDLATSLGSTLGGVVENLGGAFEFLARNMDITIASGTALVGLKLGAVFGPLGALIGAAAGALIGFNLQLDLATVKTREIQKTVSHAVAGGVEGVKAAINATVGEVIRLENTILLLQTDTAFAMQALGRPIGEAQDAFDGANAELTVAREKLSELQVALERYRKAEEAATGATRASTAELRSKKEQTDATKRATEALTDAIEKMFETDLAVGDEINRIRDQRAKAAFDTQMNFMLKIQEAREASAEADAQIAEETRARQQQEQDRIQATIDKLTDTKFHTLEVAGSMHGAMSKFFESVFTGAVSFNASIKGLFQDLASSILAEFARIAASQVFRVLFGNTGLGNQVGAQVLNQSGGSLLGGAAGGSGGLLGGGGGGLNLLKGLGDLVGPTSGLSSFLSTPIFGAGAAGVGGGGAGAIPNLVGGAAPGGAFAGATIGNLGIPIVGGILTGILTGNVKAGIGQALGSIAGFAIGGPIGALLGGAAGGFLGGLFQRGGEFTANKPTLIGVGEAGPERVSITPTGRGGSRGGSGVTIVIQGPAIFDEISMSRFAEQVQRSLVTSGRRALA